MKGLIAIIVGLMVSSFSITTQALEIRTAFVLVEDGDEESKKCRISDVSLKASVEAALRANRIQISQDVLTNPMFYVQVTTIETTTEFCTVKYDLQVRSYRKVEVQLTDVPKKNVWATIELCANGGVMNSRRIDVQQRLNDTFKGYVDMCISEISRMK